MTKKWDLWKKATDTEGIVDYVKKKGNVDDSIVFDGKKVDGFGEEWKKTTKSDGIIDFVKKNKAIEEDDDFKELAWEIYSDIEKMSTEEAVELYEKMKDGPENDFGNESKVYDLMMEYLKNKIGY